MITKNLNGTFRKTILAKKKTSKKAAKKKDIVPFEESLEQLRVAVTELEAGNLTLSDSLETYEKGVASLKQCYESLNAAQRKIELLVNLDENGNLATRPFDDAASFGGGEESDFDEDEEDSPDDDYDEQSESLF